jgi:hypothetical protein
LSLRSRICSYRADVLNSELWSRDFNSIDSTDGRSIQIPIPMTPTVIVLVLGAALLHAAWNALLRSGADRFWSIVVMGIASATVALPLTWMLAAPARASWRFMGLPIASDRASIRSPGTLTTTAVTPRKLVRR